MTSITVITLTRGRPQALRRAIESVDRQTTAATVDHLLIVDDCSETAQVLDAGVWPSRVRWRLASRAPGERSGTPRISRLRNGAVRSVDTEWIAFLDDDNSWRSDHLQSLLDTSEEGGFDAVHCHRDLRNEDGSPYLEPRFPWAMSATEAAQLYDVAVATGVMRSGSSELRTTATAASPDFRFVDMGEWLVRRRLLLEMPLNEQFSEAQLADGVGEDDLWLEALVTAGVPIGCSGEATLRYRLGGRSNRSSGT